jgi:hypothetical protein
VPSRQGEGTGRQREVTGKKVIVRVAKAGGRHFDEELILTWAFEFEFDDLPLSRLFEQNCCFGEQGDSLRLWLPLDSGATKAYIDVNIEVDSWVG